MCECQRSPKTLWCISIEINRFFFEHWCDCFVQIAPLPYPTLQKTNKISFKSTFNLLKWCYFHLFLRVVGHYMMLIMTSITKEPLGPLCNSAGVDVYRYTEYKWQGGEIKTKSTVFRGSVGSEAELQPVCPDFSSDIMKVSLWGYVQWAVAVFQFRFFFFFFCIY